MTIAIQLQVTPGSWGIKRIIFGKMCEDITRIVAITRMLPPTAAHRSSTLQDLQRGARTEIEYLNGAIVREGLRVGLPTPVNTTLYQLVRFLEAKLDR